MSRPIPSPRVWPDESEVTAANRLWAALMLARDVKTCEAICRGQPVLVANLDRYVLRRGLRGGRPPDPESFLSVSGDMLDAIDEAGVIVQRKQAAG